MRRPTSNTGVFHLLLVMGGFNARGVDILCALHKAIKTDHPNLLDSWLEATMHSSPEHVLQIPSGHCCIMKEKQVKHTMTSFLPSIDPFLAGATHY
jgi:hypothetical protein